MATFSNVLVLALDTSSKSGSVAITDGDRVLGELTVPDVGTHSEWLLSSVHGLLSDAGLSAGDIDLFAIGHGPGSFTGLRIGVSVVKGLAWATGKPVRTVSTLKAMAVGVGVDAEADGGPAICPVLDARRGEVYGAIYRYVDGLLVEELSDRAIDPAEFAGKVRSVAAGGVVFTGSGFPVYEDVLLSGVGDAGEVKIAPEELWQASGASVARLALKEGTEVTAGELKPLYMRKSEAELKRNSSGVIQ